MGGAQALKRIPRIKFPQRRPAKSSGNLSISFYHCNELVAYFMISIFLLFVWIWFLFLVVLYWFVVRFFLHVCMVFLVSRLIRVIWCLVLVSLWLWVECDRCWWWKNGGNFRHCCWLIASNWQICPYFHLNFEKRDIRTCGFADLVSNQICRFFWLYIFFLLLYQFLWRKISSM